MWAAPRAAPMSAALRLSAPASWQPSTDRRPAGQRRWRRRQGPSACASDSSSWTCPPGYRPSSPDRRAPVCRSSGTHLHLHIANDRASGENLPAFTGRNELKLELRTGKVLIARDGFARKAQLEPSTAAPVHRHAFVPGRRPASILITQAVEGDDSVGGGRAFEHGTDLDLFRAAAAAAIVDRRRRDLVEEGGLSGGRDGGLRRTHTEGAGARTGRLVFEVALEVGADGPWSFHRGGEGVGEGSAAVGRRLVALECAVGQDVLEPHGQAALRRRQPAAHRPRPARPPRTGRG